MTTRDQRTVFGEVADVYDRVRATYPAEVIDEVLTKTNAPSNSQILDLGCGTGILAAPFIERGHALLGIEPSPEMARVARRKFAGNPNFRLHLVDFENWSPGQETFDLVIAGQSWHWLDPATRLSRAAAALKPSGHIGLFWNTPQHQSGPVGNAIDEAYVAIAPDLAVGAPGSSGDGADPGDELRDDPSFELRHVLEHPWARTYTSAEYQSLLSTQSNHRLLDSEVRQSLISAIVEGIDSLADGAITVEYVCKVFLAVRSSR